MQTNWLMAGFFSLTLSAIPAYSQTVNSLQQQQVLDSARRAFNENNYPFAAERFREFLKASPTSPDAPAANLGLGIALLETPDRDAAAITAAIDSLTKAADAPNFPERTQATLFLARAQKSAIAKLDPAQSQQRLTETAARLDKMRSPLTTSQKLPENAEPSPDVILALNILSELTDTYLQLNKFKEAAETARPLLENPSFAKTPQAKLARYQVGLAQFQLANYLPAGQALATLAPFDQPYGLHARYLLARIHQLANERPEALADYKALLETYEKARTAAVEELKNQKLPLARKQFLEATFKSTPEFVARAGFYYASLLADSGKSGEASELLKKFLAANPNSPLAIEAQLRLGLVQFQTNSFTDALNTLKPLLEDKLFADQALYLSARAQAAITDTANPQVAIDAQKASLDLYRRAAEKAAALGKTNPDSKARRLDILLDYTDAQLALKLYKEAAATAAILAAESTALQNVARTEEALERQITALHLAGSYPESEALIQKFVAAYPKSLLIASVYFRSAEAAYLTALAASGDPKRAATAPKLFEEASKRYAKLLADYPDFPQLPSARFALANALYRQNKFAEAAEACKTIPDADRTGELVAIYYLHGDSLLRTLPPEGDDAIATSKMLLHAESAARNLTAFVTLAGPKNPQFADASMKLGYTQQRIGMVLAEPQERRKTLTAARDAYDKILAATPWENPVAYSASLERAKTLALLGDFPSAERELRRFTNDPGAKAPNAPLAVLRLSSLLRAVGKPQEAADLLKQLRDRDEAALLKDPARAAWVPAIQYENALALQEAGKLEDARTLYTALAAANPATADSLAAQWRLAQTQRQLLANAIASSRKAIAASTKPEAIDAARKNLDAAYRSMLEWTNAAAPSADESLKKNSGSDSAIRLSYELAWGYRVLAEAQIEAALAKLQRDQLTDILTKAQKNPAAGYVANSGLTPPPLSLASVPVQAMETKARDAYTRIIAAADAAANPLALQARIELAEILAARGKPDEALELLTEVLEKNPSPLLADRSRVRIAAALLEKGDPKNALVQTTLVLKNPQSPFTAEARYLSGEALIAQKDYPKAIEILNTLRAEPRFAGIPELSDKALLRLAYAYAQSDRWDESRQAAEALLQRFPQSPFADEARFAIAWALQSAKRPDEAVAAYTEVTKRSASETAARAQLQIGLIRLDQKKFADAAKALLVVPYTYSYADLAAPAWYNTGLAYLELKNPAEAKSAFQRLLKEHPNSQYTPDAQKKLTELN